MFFRRKLPNSILPYLAIFTTTFIWAIAGPVIKITLEFVPPFTFLLMRFLIVCIALLPFLYVELPRHKIDPRDYLDIILLGFFGQASLAFIFIGLKYTSAIDAAIMATLSPILVYLAGYYFFNEKITKQEKLGLLLATIGNAIVLFEPILSTINVGFNNVGEKIFGNVLILGYHFMWPAYIVLGKRMMGQKSLKVDRIFHYFHLEKLHKKYNPMILTALTFYVGLAIMIPLASIETAAGNFIILNSTSLFGILYMALISSIVAYGLFQWSIKKIEASEAALFTYLAPVLTLLPAKILLSETPSDFALFGMVFIAIGVIIAEKYKN